MSDVSKRKRRRSESSIVFVEDVNHIKPEPSSSSALTAPVQLSNRCTFSYPHSELSFKNETPETDSIGMNPSFFNKRALNKNDATYKLETFKSNYLLIFNQVHVDGLSPRVGTEKDVEAIGKTFLHFGFEIHEYTDLTRDEIMETLEVFKEKDFTQYGCVAVAVLTHGSQGGFLRAKDTEYNETDIINHFKTRRNPTLITKPKILIIQACRGSKSIRGVAVPPRISVHRDVGEQDESYTLPLESDILILHSSYPGNPSHRVNLHGSWFIQVLCNEIVKKSPKLDLETIITDVKRKVAIDMCHEVYNHRTGKTDLNKQMPVVMSTLIRKLYLSGKDDTICIDDDDYHYYREVDSKRIYKGNNMT